MATMAFSGKTGFDQGLPLPATPEDKEPFLKWLQQQWAAILSSPGDAELNNHGLPERNPVNGALDLASRAPRLIRENPLFGSIVNLLQMYFQYVKVSCAHRPINRAYQFAEPIVYIYKPASDVPDDDLVAIYIFRALAEYVFTKMDSAEQKQFSDNCPDKSRVLELFGRHVAAWALRDVGIDVSNSRAKLGSVGTPEQYKIRNTIAYDAFRRFFR